MDTGATSSVVIPAPAPAKLASRLLTAGLLGVVTGNINHGLLEAGDSVLLNEKIVVPSVCNLCGTTAGTKHSVVKQDVTFSDLGTLLGGSLLGKAKLEFQIPLCDGCAGLPAAPGVSLRSYGKRGDHWEVTLLVANGVVASRYAQANPGSVVSAHLPSAARPSTGPRSARAVQVGGGWAVVVDGSMGKTYDEIRAGSLAFSPDRTRVAYLATTGGKWMAVVDGSEGKAYDGVFGSIEFSPDSRRVAYPARTGGIWTVVLDGVEGKPYDDVGGPVFSPDSQRVAYRAKSAGSWALVVDGSEGKGYEGRSGAIVFSPDSRRVACVAKTGERSTVVVDGVEGPAYDEVAQGSVVFSPDGSRVAFAARTGDRWAVVVDGSEGKAYDGLSGSIVFSRDSRRVAYSAKTGARWTVVFDGVEGPAFDGLGQDAVAFSPDSGRVAYLAKTGGKWAVVIDGSIGPAYDEILRGSLAFSPDGKRVAFGAKTKGKHTVVVDGVEGPRYDSLLTFKPMILFSTDGRRVAYGAKVAHGKMSVIVDGVEEGPCEAIISSSLAFSPDGEHISYRARLRGQAAGEWTSIVAAALTSVRETEPAAPATPGPVAQQAITGSAQPQWAAEWPWTHLVPAGGIPAWAAPDPSRPPVVNLAERLRLVIGQRAGDWALVRAQNGWSGWVDGRRLVPRP